MSFDLDKELKIYVKELRNSYDNPEQANISVKRFLDFGRMLIATRNEDLINDISKLLSILKRRKFDNFYIPYALFMNYNDNIDNNERFPLTKKEQNLKNTISILSKQLGNKTFIDILYRMIRTGDNIDIVYNTENLKKIIADVEKAKSINLVMKNMSNEK